MSRLRRKIWKWSAAFVATILILLAIGVGLFRLAVPLVPELRADAEAMAERALGWPVHIGEIDLQWALLGPELVLTDVQLLAPETRQPLITAAELDIIFGPLDFFQEGMPRPSHVRLHQPALTLARGADGELYLSGHLLPDAGDARTDWRELLELALRHGRLTVFDGELHYRDAVRNIDGWTLRLAEVTLASDGEKHELEGSVLPPGALGEQLAVEFSARGAPATPEAWEWTLDFEADGMRLGAWYRQLGWSGDGDVQGTLDVVGQLAGRGLDKLEGKGSLGLADLVFADDGARDGLPGRFETVGMLWKVALDEGGGFRFDAESLVIDSGEARFENGVISVASGEKYPLEITARRLPLPALAGLTRLLPADADDSNLSRIRDVAERLAPQGEVQSLTLGLDTQADPARFHVEAEFRDLGIRRWDELPGFTRLSGHVRGDETAGELRLDSRDMTVDFGDLFRTPLPLASLAGNFSWQAAAGEAERGWRILGSDIAVTSPGVAASADLALELPPDGPAFIELTATARDVDLAVRSTWLPVGIMSDALVRWLDTAIVSGHVPEAALVLRGPLANFPFRDGSGTFDIRFAAREVAVDYARGWPRVEGLRANVHFHGPGLDIRVERAETGGLAVNGGLARFGDLRDALLEVDTQVAGDMATAWQFLASSPLQKPLGGLLRALAVSGPMRAKLALAIPLKNVAATAVKVNADLGGVAVHPVALPWTVDAVNGTVTVTESAVTAEGLTGQFTGHPFTASIAAEGPAREDGFSRTRIRMSGRTPVNAFESVLPPAWLSRLDGAFDWSGEVRVGGEADLNVRIDSALEDVTSELPAPLDTVRPVAVSITVPGGSRVGAGFNVRGLGAGRVAFAETDGRWQFERGRLSLGSTARPALPDAPGLHVEGRVPVLDVAAWLGIGTAETEAGRPLIRDFAVEAARLVAGGLTLENQMLSGTRLRNSGWELLLSGPATGRIGIPSLRNDGEPWRVDLEQLHLPGSEAAGEKSESAPASAPDPRKLPHFQLDIDDLRVGPVHLGHVSGELRRTAIGYTTQALRAEAPSFVLDLNGRWEVVQDEHYTSITSVLVSSDVADTLAALGYAGSGIDADDGRIEANLAWHAAPTAMEYGLLEGAVSFSFEDGALSEVNPGAGRLIGLLSLSALPRRLFLDFSDFFSEGLSFDTLKGDFVLTEGNAYTTNVRLEGPSISALLVGRTGLATRDYDQLAIVDPGVSASLPVAGYLAAGPSVGAALLLLSQLLEAPLSDITQVKYRITGSWDDPVIERVQDSNAQKKPSPEKQ
ncbi:MAG TPA: YhdP family protein [Gammaproteobacteria bacterium]